MSTFHCPDCKVDQPNNVKYIVRFKDESLLGSAGRERRVDTHEDGDQIRCKCCHCARGRIQRVLKSEDWGEDFKNISGEARAKLMLSAHNSFGSDLSKLLKVQLEQSHASSRLEVFTKGGGFVDEIDLNAKYKNKPEQLANIKANASQFTCPVRKCLMYQDPEYLLKNESREEHTSTTKRTIEAEVTVKKVKKAKTQPRAADSVVKVEHLKPTQVQKLRETSDKITKAEELFSACRARITDVEEHCPKFIIDKAAIQAAEFASTKASIDVAIESTSGDIKLLMRDAGTVMKNSKNLKDSLSNILDEAEAHIHGR